MTVSFSHLSPFHSAFILVCIGQLGSATDLLSRRLMLKAPPLCVHYVVGPLIEAIIPLLLLHNTEISCMMLC